MSELTRWREMYSRLEIAAICDVSVATVTTWHRGWRGVPRHALTLLKLYTGETSQAEWEDQIEERKEVLRAEERAKSERKKQCARE